MQHACHHCGYDLMGLPDRGICPECGNHYDKHSTYRAVQSREPSWTRHVKWVMLAAFTLLVLVIGASVAIGSERPWGPVLISLFIGSISGFGAFTYWWAQRQEQREAD